MPIRTGGSRPSAFNRIHVTRIVPKIAKPAKFKGGSDTNENKNHPKATVKVSPHLSTIKNPLTEYYNSKGGHSSFLTIDLSNHKLFKKGGKS